MLDIFGKLNKRKKDSNKHIIPPTLESILRKIAYNQSKNQSGLICVGVIMLLDFKKESDSKNKKGKKNNNNNMIKKKKIILNKSFIK